MAEINSFCACPVDCNSVLPAIDCNPCSPEINQGQLAMIYMTTADASGVLTDVTDFAEWTTRLTQTGGTVTSIRSMCGIGDKPLYAPITVPISHGRTSVIGGTHTINFSVDETNPTNYAAMQTLQCGGSFRIWYKTLDNKYIYGGNSGIIASISGGHVIDRAKETPNLINYTITFDSKCDPDRDLSPFPTL